MTANIAMGRSIEQVAGKPGLGERGKDFGGKFGFEEALAGGEPKRGKMGAQARIPAAAPQPVWSMGSFGAKLSLEKAAGFSPVDTPAEVETVSADALVIDIPLPEPETTALRQSEPDMTAAVVEAAADGAVPPAQLAPDRKELRPQPVPTAADEPASAASKARPAGESQQSSAPERAAPQHAMPERATPQSPAPEGGDKHARRSDAKPVQAEARRDDTIPASTTKSTPASPASAADTLAARVSVLGVSGAVAPAQPLPGATAAGLVTAMEGEASWRQAAAEAAHPAAQRSPSAALPVKSLRIQLNPAELGMVTARLTVSGSQLSIEVQAESNDARQRLMHDSDAILKALRAVGYDVEKVTIQQASPGGQGQAQPNGSAREQFHPDQQGRQDARGQGAGGEARRGNEGGGHGHGEAAAERAGGGVYI